MALKDLHPEPVEFNNDGTGIQIEALADSTILLGHAIRFNEPIVEEILQAFEDYRKGAFGSWV